MAVSDCYNGFSPTLSQHARLSSEIAVHNSYRKPQMYHNYTLIWSEKKKSFAYIYTAYVIARKLNSLAHSKTIMRFSIISRLSKSSFKQVLLKEKEYFKGKLLRLHTENTL